MAEAAANIPAVLAPRARGAAQKDAASSSFKHGVTQGCNCARPCWQTLCLGLTKLEQVTQKAVIDAVVVVVGGGKQQVRTQQDLLLPGCHTQLSQPHGR